MINLSPGDKDGRRVKALTLASRASLTFGQRLLPNSSINPTKSVFLEPKGGFN